MESATDKSVRDYSNRAVVRGGVVTVTRKVGRFTIQTHTFPCGEWPDGVYEQRAYMGRLIGAEEDDLLTRIVDSCVAATNRALAQGKGT